MSERIQKRVLVTPLDWGLGHATRCIPIIRELLQQSCEVVVAGAGQSLNLVKEAFPQLKTFEIAGYHPEYSVSGSMIIKMAGQLKHFIRVIRLEHRQLEAIVKSEKIDIVISDNRYGCWSSTAKSIFITHQLHVLLPQHWKWLQSSINYVIRSMIKKFTACWVPDDAVVKLTGVLSQTTRTMQVKYIGWLSQFSEQTGHNEQSSKTILFLLSGPEPQRTLLENRIREQLVKLAIPCVMVRGVVGTKTKIEERNLTTYDYASGDTLATLIQQASLIVSRSGYSTIMDLIHFKKKAFFIPTPGQTEQEYLATCLKSRGIASFHQQATFDLTKAIAETTSFTGFQFDFQHDLKRSIREILND